MRDEPWLTGSCFPSLTVSRLTCFSEELKHCELCPLWHSREYAVLAYKEYFKSKMNDTFQVRGFLQILSFFFLTKNSSLEMNLLECKLSQHAHSIFTNSEECSWFQIKNEIAF